MFSWVFPLFQGVFPWCFSRILGCPGFVGGHFHIILSSGEFLNCCGFRNLYSVTVGLLNRSLGL